MKQYEYMIRADKDVFEGTGVHYDIEISTNNYACFHEIKDMANKIINQYEHKENKHGNQDQVS